VACPVSTPRLGGGNGGEDLESRTSCAMATPSVSLSSASSQGCRLPARVGWARQFVDSCYERPVGPISEKTHCGVPFRGSHTTTISYS
jgi:hypothetical protein